MAMRNWRLGGLISPLTFPKTATITARTQCIRTFHQTPTQSASRGSKPKAEVPEPTPFVPDVATFLSLIGRNMSKFTDKFPSWEKLFTLSSPELRHMGIEPTRSRRYLLRKREKFRRGDYGPGGDLDNVVEGAAQLRVVEVPVEVEQGGGKKGGGGDKKAMALASSANLTPGMRRVVVNLAPDATGYTHGADKPIKRYAGMRIHQGGMIKGPFLKPLKGSNGSAGIITAHEGMWEDRLGQKLHGGERRRDEVMAKKRIEEKKNRPA